MSEAVDVILGVGRGALGGSTDHDLVGARSATRPL